MGALNVRLRNWDFILLGSRQPLEVFEEGSDAELY